MKIRKKFWNVVFLTVALTVMPAWPQSVSPSFVLRSSAATAAGGSSDSHSFRLDAAAAQPMTVGVSSSPRFVVQSGLFSFVGSGLAVDRWRRELQRLDAHPAGF